LAIRHTLLAVLGHQTFRAMANVHYSSKLFMALWLQVASQWHHPTFAVLCTMTCVFLQQIFNTDKSFYTSETIQS